MSLNFINVLWNLPIQPFGPPNAQAKFWPFLNFEGFPHGRAESAVFYRTNHVVRLGLVATMWWGLVWLQRFDFIGENFDPHQC